MKSAQQKAMEIQKAAMDKLKAAQARADAFRQNQVKTLGVIQDQISKVSKTAESMIPQNSGEDQVKQASKMYMTNIKDWATTHHLLPGTNLQQMNMIY